MEPGREIVSYDFIVMDDKLLRKAVKLSIFLVACIHYCTLIDIKSHHEF